MGQYTGSRGSFPVSSAGDGVAPPSSCSAWLGYESRKEIGFWFVTAIIPS